MGIILIMLYSRGSLTFELFILQLNTHLKYSSAWLICFKTAEQNNNYAFIYARNS